jgi:GR25 family glycosyltransferase involved in LPS biosynthesis
VYTGLYINLDRSPSRRAAMEDQISRYGLGYYYRRFAAADGNVLKIPTSLTESEAGCFTSHYLVARAHLDSSMPMPLHVVEDDCQFSSTIRVELI